ncbi:MAG: protein phosphatase CheZ [Deltaproteobacteria bacterium]|mgnify:CR=1 FL=1
MDQDKYSRMVAKLKEEVSNLALFVDKTRKGMDTIESTLNVGKEKFPEASSQLSSVTGDLENAANNIMSILEALMLEQDRAESIIKELSAWACGIQGGADSCAGITELASINTRTKNSMMDIFTNMSFHDLSGQKLKKVIATLAMVESKLLEVAVNFDFIDAGSGAQKSEMLNRLKGPSEIKPINQDVVDELLKELRS